MKKGILIAVVIASFSLLFGCGSDSSPEKSAVEKDRIEKVGDAASTIGYDGDKIEEGLREVNDLSEAHDKAADDIFDQ